MSRFISMRSAGLIAALAAAALGWAATAGAQDTAPPGDAANGKRIYAKLRCSP